MFRRSLPGPTSRFSLPASPYRFGSVWKWRGGWRIAAAVPAALIAFVVLRIAIDTAHDLTSHNLRPLEILEFGSAALAIIGILKLARRFLKVPA